MYREWEGKEGTIVGWCYGRKIIVHADSRIQKKTYIGLRSGTMLIISRAVCPI